MNIMLQDYCMILENFILLILNLADMSVNGKGEKVPVMERLKTIKDRYGKFSEEYEHAKEMVDILIKNDIIRPTGTVK